MSVAGLYLLLNASFVAAAQVLVYVGAVNVLILFAIMLVNKKERIKKLFNRFWSMYFLWQLCRILPNQLLINDRRI